MDEHLNDTLEEGESNCCGAKVYGDICAECKEHCEAIKEKELEDFSDSGSELNK